MWYMAMLGVLASTLAFGQTSQEPAYCDRDTFLSKEISNSVPESAGKLNRLHIFQLGQVTLAGLGIGQSDATAVKALASLYSKSTSEENYCTWYLNKGNAEAEASFTQIYLPSPLVSPFGVEKAFRRDLGPSMDQTSISFLSCAEKFSYIALGCDGMKHRGPSALAMVLSYSGCTPEHSVDIVQSIWGKNYVLPKIREEIADEGYEIGSENPDGRARLQAMFSS